MADRWWRTGGAQPGEDQRERSRLLRFLGRQALTRMGALSVADQPAQVVDMLVKDGTLRDLGSDRVTFRHDVFTEWAMASLLYSEPSAIANIALTNPAPATLARAVELMGRMTLAHGTNHRRWKVLLDRVSLDHLHGSWRRTVLLALVRSENAQILLTRASELLLCDDGRSSSGVDFVSQWQSMAHRSRTQCKRWVWIIPQ